MTERLADITARIEGIRQLGAVVNAMRGIAAARAQQARNQLTAVDGYALIIAAAIGSAVSVLPSDRQGGADRSMRRGLVLFCAEQGFAGPFSERILDAAGADLASSDLFLVGTRGAAAAAERNVVPRWQSAMPSHSPGIPKLADGIAEALYARIASGEIGALDTIFSRRQPGGRIRVERHRLLPLDVTSFSRPASSDAPLLHLAPETLLGELAADYVYAELCRAALHAFAAENEARMEAMASARRQIERQLSSLQATKCIVRQQDITEEIIELAAGETASHSAER
ncbi:MAG: F0F1 ATP synthase subunit gamma [Roseiarcus sp.]